jgi:NitT/TauT family transport system permease protein
LTLVAITALGEVGIRVFRIPEYLLPLPSAVGREVARETAYLLPHVATTSLEILAGFLLAVIVGVPMAMVLVYSPALERSVYPLLVGSQSIPKVAIAPLLIFWTGIGLLPKVLVAFMIAFFPIVIDTTVGLRSIEPEMLHLARSMGASETKIFLKMRLPTALPHIFAGLKVAVTLAVVGAIVGEFIQADRGLGYVLLQANAQINTPLSFAAILILALVGVVMFVAVSAIEKIMIPWHASQRSELAAGTL